MRPAVLSSWSPVMVNVGVTRSRASDGTRLEPRQRAVEADRPALHGDPAQQRVQVLQRDVGNTAVGRLLALQRQPPVTGVLDAPSPAPGSGAPAAPVALSGLSGYRTAAQGYITAYEVGAQRGITAFQESLSADFDWDLFGAQVAGNLIWATAAFASGGTAFLISVGGIALTTGAAAAAVTSAPSFTTHAAERIDDVSRYLNNQVDRVTRDVDTTARGAGWDDSRARREILRRLFADPYVVTASGGLPNVNTAAVAASVQQQLLVEADMTQPRSGSAGLAAVGGMIPTIIRDRYTGYAMYSYKVANVEDDGGWFGFAFMKPLAQWRLVSGPSTALVPSANVGDINASMNAAQRNLAGEDMHVASWPCKKAINLYTDAPESPALIVELSASNSVVATRGWGVVHEYLDEHDPLAVGRQAAARVWGSSAPPDVARLAAPPDLFRVNPAAHISPY